MSSYLFVFLVIAALSICYFIVDLIAKKYLMSEDYPSNPNLIAGLNLGIFKGVLFEVVDPDSDQFGFLGAYVRHSLAGTILLKFDDKAYHYFREKQIKLHRQ